MQNTLIAIVIIGLLGLGAWYVLSGNNMVGDTMTENEGDSMTQEEEGSMMEGDGMSMEETEPTGVGGMMEDENGVKVFTVEGGNFFFSPKTMTVKKGDTVRIVFKNTGGFHDFVIDEFDVATKQANGPAEETVEFVADQSGTFEYYCSVGSHRQMGMVGTLTVTE